VLSYYLGHPSHPARRNQIFANLNAGEEGLSHWLEQLLGRTHQNVVIVTLANKPVRMAWAVLCENERYRAPVLAVTN
jgi:hypothetical protein